MAQKNAGILAAQILGCSDGNIRNKIIAYKKQLETIVEDKAKKMIDRD